MVIFLDSFPRDVGTPKRKVVHSKQEFAKFVNDNIKYTDLYSSVYGFRAMNGQGVDYSTAIIDRLFFDHDGLDKHEQVRKLHELLKIEDILHTVVFSGGGFHTYIFTRGEPVNKKGAVQNAQTYFIKKLGLEIDPCVIGEIARISRIPGSFNWKRGRFCIGLTEEELYKNTSEICELALKQRFGVSYSGRIRLSLDGFDLQPAGNEANIQMAVAPIEDLKLGDIKMPPCMKNLLMTIGGMTHSWKERTTLITFLKESHVPYEECLEILKQRLSPSKFHHCLYSEHDPQRLYRQEKRLFFPSCDTLRTRGYAGPGNVLCEGCTGRACDNNFLHWGPCCPGCQK